MIATKRLRQQQNEFFIQLWQGAVLAALGLWGSMTALPLGTGALLAQHRTSEMAVPLFCSGIFLLAAFAGFRRVLRGGLGCLPGHTPLGRSLHAQGRRGQRLSALLREVDADRGLAQAGNSTLAVGDSWVLGQEAMRLADIRGVFTLESGIGHLSLCLVDVRQREQSVLFPRREQLEEAVSRLRSRAPAATFGDAEAYMAYTVQAAFPYTDLQLKPYY